jgi:hypothetical protein
MDGIFDRINRILDGISGWEGMDGIFDGINRILDGISG